ncbi:hypothetical protein GQ44DRAFT_780427 [Phaeosphaeriaceae sp. PMI808]|nr:hypothetical protein GQ44DRAFT_780427 [Phaeosphaeriaceae sp. PMI808]
MTCTPPFALFIIEEDIDNAYVNASLKHAFVGNFEMSYQLWVATGSYADMPKDHNSGCTEPRIPSSFRSPWIGKTVEDCAKWLQGAPEDTPVNKEYFTVMNEYSKEDNTVLVCRISEEDGFKVEYFPQSTDEVSMQMHTNDGPKFDEKASNYQTTMEAQGRADRSRAGPYK